MLKIREIFNTWPTPERVEIGFSSKKEVETSKDSPTPGSKLLQFPRKRLKNEPSLKIEIGDEGRFFEN